MKSQHPPWVTLSIVFLIALLAIATGPIGLMVLVMIGVPVLAFIALGMMAHSGRPDRR
jgi:hypothetical protein